MIEIYFLYGLGFFCLGIALAVREAPRALNDLAPALKYLSAFGFMHGIHEWVVMATLAGSSLAGHTLDVLSIFTAGCSFIVLMIAAMLAIAPASRSRIWAWYSYIAVTGLIWLALTVSGINDQSTFDLANFVARWSLGAPAALILGSFLVIKARHLPIPAEMAHSRVPSAYLLTGGIAVSGLSLVAYGLLTFAGPELAFFPADIVNETIVLALTDIPVQVFRTGTAVILGASMVISLSRFQILERGNLEHQLLQGKQDLAESEARLTSIIDNLPVAVLITDDESRNQMANQTFRDWYGVTPDRSSGQSADKYLSIEEQEMEVVRAQETYVRSQGKAISRETKRRLADGELHDLLIEKHPFYDNNGTPIGVVSVAMDITELRKAQTAEHSLFAAIDSLPVGLALFDPDDRLVVANQFAYEHTAWRPSMLVKGNTYEQIIRDCAERGEPLNARENPDAWVADRLEKHRSGEGATWNRQPDGRVMYAVERKTANGSTVALRFDVTDQKRTEEQLNQAQKMEAVGRLAGGIAHDFNNLLGAIMGFAEFLEEDLSDDSPQHEYAQRITRAGQRAKQLVHQILAISRTGQTEFEPLNVANLLNEHREFLLGSVPPQIQVAVETSDDHLMIEGDPGQLSQVIMNLGVNARDAIGSEGGRITISAAAAGPDQPDFVRLGSFEGDKPETRFEVNMIDADTIEALSGAVRADLNYLCISIEDNGTGITRENMERMFEPFFTTKDSGKGTGLGLSVVQGIILSHRGALSVQSQKNAGTIFRLYLPLIENLTADIEASDANTDTGPKNCVVMIVEDEQEVAEMISIGLERMGHQSEIFADARSALKEFRQDPWKWDAVVTDQHMPKMRGDELIEAINKTRTDIPCILCTGYSETLNDERARSLGADAFFFKPVSLKDIEAAFQKALQRQAK